MERLTDLSNLRVVESSNLHQVLPTQIGIRERYRAIVNCTTSVESSRDTFTFNVLPALNSELDLRDCYVKIDAKCTKNGSAYSASDQVSSCQALGILAWDSVRCYIGKLLI